jgi:hypothetical protein
MPPKAIIAPDSIAAIIFSPIINQASSLAAHPPRDSFAVRSQITWDDSSARKTTARQNFSFRNYPHLSTVQTQSRFSPMCLHI